MDEPAFLIEVDLEDMPVTPTEIQLFEDLLPELIKDMLWLQTDED